MSNEHASSPYKKLQDAWNPPTKVAARAPDHYFPPAPKPAAKAAAVPSPEYKFGPVAKVVSCLIAIPVAFVVYMLSPITFLMIVICVGLAASAPSVADQAKEQIAIMDEVKKQLDARK